LESVTRPGYASGYAMSQRKRPLIEKVFGWLKPVAGLRKVKLRDLEKIQWLVQFAAAAYNLWRMLRLTRAT
jgi:Transposase DDE domain